MLDLQPAERLAGQLDDLQARTIRRRSFGCSRAAVAGSSTSASREAPRRRALGLRFEPLAQGRIGPRPLKQPPQQGLQVQGRPPDEENALAPRLDGLDR